MKNFNEHLFSSMGNPTKPIRRSIRQSNDSKTPADEEWEKKKIASISTNASSVNNLYCSLGKNKLKQLDQYDIFKCPNCEADTDTNCQVCNGQIELSGKSSIVKFMEYIIQFKMGFKDSYVSEKMQNKNQNQPNTWCTDVIANSIMRSSNMQSLRMSEGASNMKLYQSSMINKCQSSADVHNGYQCDNCKCCPIKGPRHHCKVCQDYDLCQQCYITQGHQHEMNTVQSCLLYSSISGILQKLNKQKKTQQLKDIINKRKIGSELMKPLGSSSIYRSSIR